MVTFAKVTTAPQPPFQGGKLTLVREYRLTAKPPFLYSYFGIGRLCTLDGIRIKNRTSAAAV